MKDHDIISDELSSLKTLLLTDDRNNFQEQLIQNKKDILDTINQKINELKQLNNHFDIKVTDLNQITEDKLQKQLTNAILNSGTSLTSSFDSKIELLNNKFAETIQKINNDYAKLNASQNAQISNIESTMFDKLKDLDKSQTQKMDFLNLSLQKNMDSTTKQLIEQNKKLESINNLFMEKIKTIEEQLTSKIEQNLLYFESKLKLQSEALLNTKADLSQEFTSSNKKITDSFNNILLTEKNQTSDQLKGMQALITEYKSMAKTQTDDLQRVIADNLESLSMDLQKKIEEGSLQQMQFTQKISKPDFLEEQTNKFITNLLNKKVIEDPNSMAAIISPILNQALMKSSANDRLNITKELSPLIAVELSKLNETLPKNQDHLTQLISDNLPQAIELQNLNNTPHLPNSLAPLIGKGLQAQINDEKDKIVDALYPVIGSTISKYMAESMKELVHKINTKIEEALSFKKYFKRLRGKAFGNTNSELINEDSINADPQSIYLIHKKTGVVILDSHKDGSENSQKHMVGGMFSAITSFVNDWIEKEGENKAVDSIEYGDSKVIFEASGSLIIAVVVNFGDTHTLRSHLRTQLADLHLSEHNFIENFKGDTQSVPERIKDLFKPLFIN